MARRSGGGKRPTKSVGDEPPDWPLGLGIGGLVVSAVGRALGGPGGADLADMGCAATMVGALAFAALLLRRMFSTKGKQE